MRLPAPRIARERIRRRKDIKVHWAGVSHCRHSGGNPPAGEFQLSSLDASPCAIAKPLRDRKAPAHLTTRVRASVQRRFSAKALRMAVTGVLDLAEIMIE
jgi:hypothetical protein